MNETNAGVPEKYLMPGAVVLAGLLIGGAVFVSGHGFSAPSQSAAATQGTAPQQATADISKVKTAGEPFIGDPNAPVTIAEWSDYQCPFCKQFELSTLPEIVQNYVSEGKVKIVFKDFQFLGPNSLTDAEWARAIWALYPSQFAAWRTAIYSNEPQENSLSASDDLTFLQKTTGGVKGIDIAKVQAAVAANQSAYDAAINADRAEGTSFGVNATPTFIVGTQLIAGAQPYASFDSALKLVVK